MKKMIPLIIALLIFINGYSQIQSPISQGSIKVGGGLSDRGMAYEPIIKDQSEKAGRVVTKVCVNHEGKVTSADYTQRGSTTTDSHLRRIAESAAYQVKFLPGELKRQCGTITIDFSIDPVEVEGKDEDNIIPHSEIFELIESRKGPAKEYLILAISKVDLGDYTEALGLINKAQEIKSDDFGVLAIKAVIKTYLNDYRGAIKDYDKAIEIKPDKEELYLWRGMSNFSLGKFEKAIIDNNKAIDLNSEFAEAYANRGLSKLQAYNIERSEAILEGEVDDVIEKQLTKKLDDACLDLSKAGELGYYKAYDIIKEACN